MEDLADTISAVSIVGIASGVITSLPLITARPGGGSVGIPEIGIAWIRQLVAADIQNGIAVRGPGNPQIPAKRIGRNGENEILEPAGRLASDVRGTSRAIKTNRRSGQRSAGENEISQSIRGRVNANVPNVRLVIGLLKET